MLVENNQPLENIQDFFPVVCTEEPAHNSAFCTAHTELVKSRGYKTPIRDFIKECGADPSHYTKAGKEKVRAVLRSLMTSVPREMTTHTAEIAQGTSYLLRNREVTNEENFQSEFDGEKCSKNTGEIHRLHNWSRGIFQVVGAGGGQKSKNMENEENQHFVISLSDYF